MRRGAPHSAIKFFRFQWKARTFNIEAELIMQSEVEHRDKQGETSLYETDYQHWLDRTILQLRTQDFDHLDLKNLIEEMESLGKSDKRAISSYLMRLCEHLLKIQYWASEREFCFRGWDVEITNLRFNIQAILKDSPSLRNHLNEVFVAEYSNARKLFLKASLLSPDQVPERPDFTLMQALDENWLPWQPQIHIDPN